MGFTLAYRLGDNLYLNITNQCLNNCVFCLRSGKTGIGYNLWLDREPTAKEVLQAAGDVGGCREVVFCGYGEPLLRPDVVRKVSRELKKKYSARIRVDTNGLAEKALGVEILPTLSGVVDAVSISLNAPDAAAYDRLCRSSLGPEAFHYVLEFARRSKKYLPRVCLTVVGLPGLDMKACKKVAEKLGAEFRIRSYLEG